MGKFQQKKKGAAKKGPRTPRRSPRKKGTEAPNVTQPSDEDSDVGSVVGSMAGSLAGSLAGDHDLASSQSQSSSDEQEEQIAELFEARPFFYDKGHPKYKNSQFKNSELFEFSKVIGISREYYNNK